MDTTSCAVNVDKFGNHVQFFRVPGVDMGDWPLISEFAYMTSIIGLTVVAVVVALCRTILRYHYYRKLDVDDGIFVLAVICTICSSAFNIYCMDFFYVEVQIASGALIYAHLEDVVPATIQYLQVLYGVSALQWISIFGVKTCYLVFFRRLTRRVPGVRTIWWITLAITLVSFVLNATFAPYICAYLGPDILVNCPLDQMTPRSQVLNYVTGALDILTDVMIISIPILLLAKVKINLRRKIAVASILSLSSAMVAVSLIRLFQPPEGSNVVDTVWYIYWISLEAAIAIIMVSITGFRGLFGVKDSTSESSGHTPTPLLEIISSASARMSRFFIWTNNSSRAASQSSRGPISSNSMEKKIPSIKVSETQATHKTNHGFFFRWTNHSGNTIDQSTTTARSVDTSGVSFPSKAMSPLSSMDHNVSPLSSGVDLGATRTSDSRNDADELPIFMHSGSLEVPRQSASSRGLDGWARTAALREYEDRSKRWARKGRLTPPAESWTFDKAQVESS